MATLANTDVLFFFTSPRTPERMLPELAVLEKEFQGKSWRAPTQENFYRALAKHPDFRGSLAGDLAFKARDRITRAPKALGFVSLKPTIQVTAAGKAFLQAETEEERSEVLLRQLLKFQFPSPNHTDSTARFRVKPYLELMRLVRDLDGLSKDEIALFALGLMDYRLYERVRDQILRYRGEKSSRSKTERHGDWLERQYAASVERLYAEKLAKGEYRTRERDSHTRSYFIRTKARNQRDYADAAIRYLRATGLFSVHVRSQSISVLSGRVEDVDHVLSTVGREPVGPSEEYLDVLHGASNVTLLADRPDYLRRRLSALGVEAQDKDAPGLKAEYTSAIERLLEERLKQDRARFSQYAAIDDIIAMYNDLPVRGKIFDAPLFLEWNTWRAMETLNHGLVQPNLRMDVHGEPLYAAAGGLADLECSYKDFDLIVEVTLSSGQKQYDMEGEPVARHYGKKRGMVDPRRPVYCLFLAPKISEGALAHFFSLQQIRVKAYGGEARIVPLDLPTWSEVLNAAGRRSARPNDTDLMRFLQSSCEAVSLSRSEEEWLEKIRSLARTTIGGT